MSVDIKKEYDWADSDDDDLIIIAAIDSTGIKIIDRGQWMSDKWCSIRKGYLKSYCCKYEDQRNPCIRSNR